MPYVLGAKSQQNLVGVHPVLAMIVRRAIQLTEQDFAVHEGVRSLARQRKLVAAGASKTLNSMHIPMQDKLTGTITLYGHAVDLVPYIAGQLRWEWEPCYRIACAMDAAAHEQGHAEKLCWGGVWDRYMSGYGGDANKIRGAVADYVKRHPGPDFLDGPHYQLGRLG